MQRRYRRLFFAMLSFLFVLAPTSSADVAPQSAVPLGLPSRESQNIAAPDLRRVDLGRRLFGDRRISADGSISCSSCHDPARAFSDGKQHAVGVAGRTSARNAPSLLDVAYQKFLFWDGRTTGLEAQVRLPLINRSEHGLRSEEQVVGIVSADEGYQKQFAEAFARPPGDITIKDIASAVADYERTLLSGNSAFDRYRFGDDKAAMSEAAKRGLSLFEGRAQCVSCHLIDRQFALFTDQQFHASTTALGTGVTQNLSAVVDKVLKTKQQHGQAALDQLIADDPEVAALGRFNATLNPADIGQFKTPSLRNVALTAPYMHDGGIPTLEQAIQSELYVRGAALSYPIVLTASEQQDLLVFLRALTGS